MTGKVYDVRIAPDVGTASRSLGRLADLAGTRQGQGFNRVARPNLHCGAPLCLQVSHPERPPFQYAQLTVPGTRIRNPPNALRGWPQVFVATLRKSFL
jgi:hypothetical protein